MFLEMNNEIVISYDLLDVIVDVVLSENPFWMFGILLASLRTLY